MADGSSTNGCEAKGRCPLDPRWGTVSPQTPPSVFAGGPVDPRLLEILVCPLTKGPLVYDRQRGELVSEKAGLAYPIRDGIPIMLPDEARRLDA